MCDDEKRKEEEHCACNCIAEIVNKIIHLQRNSFKKCCKEGCDRPFLGPYSE